MSLARNSVKLRRELLVQVSHRAYLQNLKQRKQRQWKSRPKRRSPRDGEGRPRLRREKRHRRVPRQSPRTNQPDRHFDLGKKQLIKARATVRVIFGTKQQADAIAKALSPELFNPAGERATARLVVRGLTMSIHFEARDSIALRAIMSSGLRILAASLNVSDSLIQLERSYSISKGDKGGK